MITLLLIGKKLYEKISNTFVTYIYVIIRKVKTVSSHKQGMVHLPLKVNNAAIQFKVTQWS